MELTLYHKFDPLSVADSGKQHKFTWCNNSSDTEPGNFLCHAMYQSGNDKISTSDGKSAKRGQVLRLQFDENGKCSPGNGVEIQIDNKDWKADDYTKLANFIMNDCKTEGKQGKPLSKEQKAAVFCQLSSLYNLTATQYGDVFFNGIPALTKQSDISEIKNAINEMVADPKLKSLSKWSQKIAEALLEGKEPNISSPTLAEPSKQENLPEWTWSHGIQAENGAKGHIFAFYKRKDNLPPQISHDPNNPNFPYLKIAEAGYMSGEHGNNVVVVPIDPNKPLHADMKKALPLRVKLGAQAAVYPSTSGKNSHIQSPVDPVPALSNAKIINDSLSNNNISLDQATCALIMTASLYRLVATRYGGGFGYDPEGKKLAPHFFDDPKSDKDASAAKKFAQSHGHAKNKSDDYFIGNGQVYSRPLTIKDNQTLEEYIRDGKFSKEADNAVAIAASAIKNKSIEGKNKELPLWELRQQIGDHSQVAYRE